MYNGGIQLENRDTALKLPQIRLGLSNDVAVERVLSDVPFFSVGVMAFAVFTFFLATKRSNLLATYLYSSTLLAFIAAIFDLSHLLTFGPTETLSPNGLEIAREVGLSLSVGFRMIFFWGLVGDEPSREKPLSDDESLVSFRMGAHGSSWSRLGVLGSGIKWLLLLLITAIPVLQIVWRLYRRMHYNGPLYIVESSLEIAVLTIFVLKILLNVGLAESTPWRSSLLFYLAPLFALAINLSLAIGNLIFFCFSETTLGRFLQAIGLYIVVLWVMIIAFRQTQSTATARQDRPRSSFQSRPEKGPFPSDILTAPMEPQVQASSSRKRPSISSRLSSFVSRAQRPPASPIEEALWTPSRSVHPFATSGAREAADNISSKSIAMESDYGPHNSVRYASPEPSGWISSTSAVDITATTSQSPAQVAEIADLGPSNRQSQAANSFTFSAYYNPSSPLPSPTAITTNSRTGGGSESPIYSLYGIIPGNQSAPLSSRLRPVSSRLSSLIREQREMDKSISKLLSPRESLRSSNGRRKTDSYSARSEFSLSNFPAPPHTDMPAETSVASVKRNSRLSRVLFPSFSDRVPAGVENISDESLEAPRPHFRMDSQGTQYDVTSFIGAGIRGSDIDNNTRIRKETLSDIESEDGEARQSASRESTTMLNLQSGALLSTYASDETARGASPSPQLQLKPLYLGRGSPDISSSPRLGLPPRPGPSTLSKPRMPLKARPRPTVSRPRSFLLDPEPADIYEKPRPPPLIFRTLNYNP